MIGSFGGVKLAAGDSIGTTLAGANADGVKHSADEDFAVADFTSVCRLDDGINHGVSTAVVNDDLNLHLREEIDGVFTATVDLGMALLAAKSFDLNNSHAFDSDFGEGFFDILQFERLDDRFDFFHG